MKVLILERIVKWLVGGALFDFVSASVAIVNDEALTGAEKRDKVFKEAKGFSGDSFTLFINLAIEVAVLALRTRIEKSNGN